MYRKKIDVYIYFIAIERKNNKYIDGFDKKKNNKKLFINYCIKPIKKYLLFLPFIIDLVFVFVFLIFAD